MAQGRQAAEFDAVVVGAGPNGLAASTTLAAAGASVLVVEGAETVGGGTRSAELTLPGFVHDVCSAIHPLGVASPYLASLPLDRHGLQWAQPEVPLAHALDGGRAATLQRSVEATDEALGEGQHWASVLGPLVQEWEGLVEQLMGPVLRPPVHPLLLGRFGLRALWPAEALARRVLDTEAASALFAGVAAHSITPLHKPLTSAPALVLAAAGHAVGWPAAKGGSQWIADAMAAHLVELGGTIETGRPISSLGQLPRSHAVLFDTTPAQLADIAGERLPDRYRRRLRRFRHGSASFKVDYALDGPVPWTAEACRRAGTVHLGGTMAEVAAAEREVGAGRHPERPFVIVAQQSAVDPSRAPAGKATLWAYCHVPFGSTVDMTGAIQAQIERHAPGFGDLVLARVSTTPADLAAYNPNYVGGDIAGGASDGLQLLFRPKITARPYTTPAEDIFLCSSSTPPGAAVHGMCGHWAAKAALRHLNRR